MLNLETLPSWSNTFALFDQMCPCVFSVFCDTGVAPHCLDPGTVRSVTVEDFCGENWEESMKKHQTIKSMSKPTMDV